MYDSRYRKHSGYEGEDIVQSLYESHGYTCKDKNFTIRGWEIDLIMENDVNIIFVECKVVNYIDNLHDYITSKKLQILKHAIDSYLWKYPTDKHIRVDVVFIKNKEVIEIVKNIEL